jgi:hypothetical protein
MLIRKLRWAGLEEKAEQLEKELEQHIVSVKKLNPFNIVFLQWWAWEDSKLQPSGYERISGRFPKKRLLAADQV